MTVDKEHPGFICKPPHFGARIGGRRSNGLIAFNAP
jgi:hypothetical protein